MRYQHPFLWQGKIKKTKAATRKLYSPVSNICNEVSLHGNIQRHSAWCLKVIVPLFTAVVKLSLEIAANSGRSASTEMLTN